jgi:hypothetical protein
MISTFVFNLLTENNPDLNFMQAIKCLPVPNKLVYKERDELRYTMLVEDPVFTKVIRQDAEAFSKLIDFKILGDGFYVRNEFTLSPLNYSLEEFINLISKILVNFTLVEKQLPSYYNELSRIDKLRQRAKQSFRVIIDKTDNDIKSDIQKSVDLILNNNERNSRSK